MRRNSRPLLIILAVSLGLTGFLAYRAWDAAHRRRWDAMRTLNEYAGFAAWEIGISAKEQLYSQALWMFAPVNPAAPLPPGAALPGPGILSNSVKPAFRCDPDLDASVFRVDLRRRELTTAGPAFAPAFASWIRDTVYVESLAHPRGNFTYYGVSRSIGGEQRAIVFTVKWDAADAPLAAYGTEFCLDRFARPMYEKIITAGHVLPPSFTRWQPNDSLFSVVVTDAAGGTVATSRSNFQSEYTAMHVIDAFGGLKTRVTLRPDIAEFVYPNGLPRSNLPLVIASLTLALALVIGGVMLLRREDELQRLRTDFIASVSHELRTPLAQLRMFAETLLLGRVRNDAERTRSLEIIDQEARRLSHLVENILQFSRAERQAVVLSRVEQPVAPLLRETVEIFLPVARARQVSVTSAFAEDAIAKVDASALRQVVLNLLDNAVKYGPAGQAVHIALKTIGNSIRISVEDEGPGIPASDRLRIWKAFQRLERDVNSAVAGSGIGLAVVCELVMGHEGRAWVETPESGRGARFVIEIPSGGTSA